MTITEALTMPLKEFDNSKVQLYIDYVNTLALDKDNKWFKGQSIESFVRLYRRSVESGLPIDGDSVTLTFRGKLIITYDYHAYKNKVLQVYPETVFDYGIVYKGDDFEFKKESGLVQYKHNINDPFNNEKEIIGAYGIIKNDSGEFIELLNMGDIEKMQNTSKMKAIWKNWFDRMVLKSVIKRICSTHFHDITKQMEVIDNEENEPENALIDSKIQTEIDQCNTDKEVTEVYKKFINEVEDKRVFISLCGERRKELKAVKA